MSQESGTREKVRIAASEIEAEVRRLITYLNDEVVPEVRRSSSAGLRVAAGHLARLAEHLEQDTRGAGRSRGSSTL